ncbi:MAG TPA: alpha-glucosidase C-terminal domain-containing protein, partial [Oligoflexia bacterium]|nr:alpha-glucosidase C-terminal domain-containing protein [Oligoflexia bacterium]
KAYFWHRFYPHQPDLNLNNPRVVNEVIRVLRFWLDMGIDGLRLDAVPYLCTREGTNNENLPETHAVLKRMRSVVDGHYKNRMLLAEANQWPDEVLEYFGDGDECHMAFHFPLMPRIFIALKKEDREPIVDIFAQTPRIPETCQWAVFLRNHDELTLEMVTSEERDYMWSEYAADPRMRLNLGIRRRLAPLVDNSFRRIELLNSLLFSLPGAPVIYYGDEIGMGDNVFLGDRDGVRTPMQWSSDRNAGFSTADPARLYLPVIMDPVYGYQAVNVEAQSRAPSSMLNFMKRLIALRRQYKAFARGDIEFLNPANKKVLAYFRTYREEVILCVVNLSRFVQPVELVLDKYAGWFPIEIFGRTEFPRIGSLPYFITLAPHGFYWFKLEPAPQPIRNGASEQRRAGEVPTLMVEDLEGELFERRYLFPEIEEALLEYVARQGWFKAPPGAGVKLAIEETVKIGARLYFVFVEVVFDDRVQEFYSLPLRVVAGTVGEHLAEEVPGSIVAFIRTPREKGVLADALSDKIACQVLLQMLDNERRFVSSGQSELQSFSEPLLGALLHQPETLGEISLMPVTQSNTTVNFGSRLLLKVFRRLDEGVNPELETSRFLADETSFRNAPRLGGWLQLKLRDAKEVTVGVCLEYIEHKSNGWDWAVDGVRSLMETQSADGLPALRSAQFLGGSGEVDAPVLAILGPRQKTSVLIGRRLAELHLALAAPAGRKAFAPVKYLRSDAENAGTEIHQRLTKVSALFSQAGSEIGDGLDLLRAFIAGADRLVGRAGLLSEQLAQLCQDEFFYKIRCHGDLQLKELLLTDHDVFFVDFEGHTGEAVAKRRMLSSPVKDVARLLRSLSDAAFDAACGYGAELSETAAEERLGREKIAAFWVQAVSACLVESYRRTIRDSALEMSDRVFMLLIRQHLLADILADLERVYFASPKKLRIPLLGLGAHAIIDGK